MHFTASVRERREGARRTRSIFECEVFYDAAAVMRPCHSMAAACLSLLQLADIFQLHPWVSISITRDINGPFQNLSRDLVFIFLAGSFGISRNQNKCMPGCALQKGLQIELSLYV